MRIALAQMYCPWGDVAGNLRRMTARVRRAAARHADLVVFPECSVHGMWKDHMVRLAAESVNGPIVQRMGRCGDLEQGKAIDGGCRRQQYDGYSKYQQNS